MRIAIDATALSEATKSAMELPGVFQRARKSALKSVGWFVMTEMRDFVEGGGDNWRDLHPLTQKFKKKFRTGRWIRRGKPHPGPLFWLGKFARYRANRAGDYVEIDFGKSRKGEPGTFDPDLIQTVKRVEEGETIQVTPKMRKFVAATRGKSPKKPEIEKHYFALKASTKTIDVPQRKILGPAYAKIEKKIAAQFEKKFWDAVARYGEGGK